MKHVGVVAMVFTLGCVAGGVASRVAVPPARASSDAPRWEYNCGVDAKKAQLDEAGALGWELVSTVVLETDRTGDITTAQHVQFCFKRPL